MFEKPSKVRIFEVNTYSILLHNTKPNKCLHKVQYSTLVMSSLVKINYFRDFLNTLEYGCILSFRTAAVPLVRIGERG